MTPVVLTQHRTIVARIIHSSLGIPEHGTLHILHLLGQTMLGRLLMLVGILQVLVLHRTLDILTDKQGTGASVLVPPTDQRLVIGSLIANLPVNLRHTIVKPAIIHPHQHISIQVIIVLQAVGITADSSILLVTVDTKRRDTHLYPRLHGMYRLIELLDKQVYVIPAPVATILDAITMKTILRIIRNNLSCCRIRIEIVIHMNTIHIVTGHDILGHLTDIVTVLRNTRIQYLQSVVVKTSLRMLNSHMSGSQCRCTLCLRTIRIDPRMQLHATLMTLFNHPLQGIPIR